ncbi:MAG: glycoside hydrolase family 97 catalytic domain-containing protein [Kiritimatiellae bacterium]|nr:glycoside hydrolase family 97 catalytic domain-containing protein [Kiritimatiellia bacterium]
MKLGVCAAGAVLLALVGCSLEDAFNAELNVAVSPDGKNEIRLYTTPLSYEVLRDGVVVVAKTEIGLKMDGKDVREGAEKPISWARKSIKRVFAESSVYKKGKVDLSANETVVDFGDWCIRLAARNDGVAYRFATKKGGVVDDERADLTVPKGARCWFNRTNRTSLGCEETVPEFADASALPSDGKKAFYLPFVYSVGGKTVAVVDADVHDYPVWNFGDVEQGEAGATLKSLFAKYPKKTFHAGNDENWKLIEMEKGGRWVRVKEREDFIAKASAPAALPWRAFVLADEPAKLCESDISYALATPAVKDVDFSWVKPGKVAWDWWNCFDNGAGCNTKTYERFIDFAAANGVEYVIFDEGWSARLNIWEYSPSVDVPHLIDYANKKGVGIILWMAWAQVYGDEEHVAEHFAKLGAKGFKVDFMDRADAEVATFLEKFAAACAKHRMVVDYHGAYRPVGLHRMFPNVLNYEGVHGLEQMKWGQKEKDMCYNDVACFFLRMTAGQMDYTPGAMDNYPIGGYAGDNTNPGSVGTRCHQMALMALYEAPLQMLSDSPTKYEKNMECFSFMAKTPVVWDDTVGLGGSPETFAAAARKAKDGAWYAAGITNKEARDFAFRADFLGAGEWTAEVFRDAGDAAADVRGYVHETKRVKAGEELAFHMAPGGGFVVRFSK